MEEVIRKAVELGIDGVDMTGYWFKSTDPAYLASLRHLAFKNGVCFSGAAIGASTVQAEPGKRAQVLEEIKKWVDVTESLGAPHLRVFAGKLPAGATIQQAVEWTVDTLKAACEYAGKKGITLGMEDHEGITQNSDACLEIVHRVGSPFFGINLDITNFIATAKADETGKPWTSTACGRFLHGPITKASCPRNMKVKRILPRACPSWSTKSKPFAGNIPQFDL